MGGFSIWHWLILGIVVMLLFGKGRMSDLMGDMAKGIKSFKKGMADDEEEVATSARPTPRLQPQQPIEPNQTVELQPAKDDRPSA